MAIEFKHRGKLWRADTAKEAIELRQQLEAEDRALIDAGEIPDDYSEEDVWTPDAVVDLLKGVGERQKRFIKLLFEENEILSAKVVKKLGLSSEVALAGALSGLSKQLKKLNIKPSNLYTVVITWEGKTKTRAFSLSNQFKWAAEELGWPDNWI